MPECHSTNDEALSICQHQSPTEGTVIITNNQKRGKGQRGNRWVAEPGKNLTFSLILKPAFLPARHQFFLNIILSLAVHDALAEFIAGVCIKWPNDILVGNRKISGILVESSLQGASINYAVCGLGINVNQRDWEEAGITSLQLERGRDTPLDDLLSMVLENIESRYLRLRTQNADHELHREYLSRLLGFEHEREFKAGGTLFTGSIVGVDPGGRLEVKTGPETRLFRPKEIEFVLD